MRFWTLSIVCFLFETCFGDWILSPSFGNHLFSQTLLEIETMRHDVVLVIYSQKFLFSTMNPPRCNCLSDTLYQGIVIIPYVKCISEKFRCIGNDFNTDEKLVGLRCPTDEAVCAQYHVIVTDITLSKQADL
jgi:hypothetical protein